MAIIKCKMCGGDLNLIEGQSVAECEYCGSKQTVPTADNEKKLTLFARANRLRAACEFDKAAGIYEAIVADFPEEAESYWGLVLCKYGIEYVDDPATGKKIPTCHRSSFDSVMDDSNFEQAMENADEMALRVYRQEAKQIEEIRKGILAVSSSEKPYDIFICYKETDAEGNRTVDSLLAQDIYDALIGKNYRVFFSRITLEDKLGVEYEPYIFAALNSAKIMLAVGTCYEHYNAVWVKNEWSRYLKIVAQDKNKYLIPCYKNIDAYDIPKEFAHLQGQDMGKVGAIADLLRGIEKLIPRQTSNTVAAQEKIVVGNAGSSNKIASLLDRGNMALEDGDWAKADSFFEDVLNNDSKHAQAYLGKTLAQERCRTMDALIRKRRDVHQNVGSEKRYIKEKTTHIGEMAAKYRLSGYVSADSIRKLYNFDLSYLSEASGRLKQYRDEESWWQNHRWLSRAEKFASGAMADTLQSEKKHLFAQLGDRVKKAQEADVKAVAKLEAAYEAHIVDADRRAEKLYNDGLNHRKQDYERYLAQAKQENNPATLTKLAEKFDALGTYQDSRNLAAHCRKRAAEEKEKAAAEAERRKMLEQKRKEAEEQKKRETTAIAIVIVLLIVGAIAVGLMSLIRSAEIDDIDRQISQFVSKEITLESADGFEKMDKLLAGLSDKEKRKLDSLNKLIDARMQYELLVDQEAARIEALIDAIPAAENIHLATEEQIKEAESAYNRASDAVKAKITNNEALTRAYEQLEKVKEAAWTDCTNCGGDGKVTCSLCKGKGSRIVNHTTPNGKTWQVSQECSKYQRCSICNGQGGIYVEKNVPKSDAPAPVSKKVVASDSGHTIALRSDGTVYATGDNAFKVCDVAGWSDIVSVATSGFMTLGLKSDGTVVGTGDKGIGLEYLPNFYNVAEIAAADMHYVLLHADGTVDAGGVNQYGQMNVESWKDVVAIDAALNFTVGLKSDGTVLFAGQDEYGQKAVTQWSDIVKIDIGSANVFGLKSDGTVVVTQNTGRFRHAGQAEVSGWTDVVDIAAGALHTVGLKSDGTVVAVGDNKEGQCNVGQWRNVVAVFAGDDCTIGVKSDGTVVATGKNNAGCLDFPKDFLLKLPAFG